MLTYRYDAFSGGGYLVAGAESALTDIDRYFYVAGEAFDVGVDNDVGFCYGFEMRVEQASLSFSVDKGDYSYRLEGMTAGQRDDVGMVFDFFLDKKCTE